MLISGKVPQGTWYAIPCFTSYTGFTAGSWNSIRDIDGEPMLLFPFCNAGQITVNQSGGGEAADAVEQYDVNIDSMEVETISAYDMIYEIRELLINIEGTEATVTRNVSYSIQITDAMSGGNIESGSESIPAGDSVYVEPIKEDRQETWHRYQSGSGESVLQVILTVTVQGETATKTFNFPIEDTQK